jgi:hypothetical protein
MTVRSYQRQHLSLFAAGYINAAGDTVVTFGCQLTRIASGEYGVILGASDGLVDNETFTFVTAKAGAATRYPVVEDTSNTLKTVRVFSSVPSQIDTGIEVALYRPTNT